MSELVYIIKAIFVTDRDDTKDEGRYLPQYGVATNLKAVRKIFEEISEKVQPLEIVDPVTARSKGYYDGYQTTRTYYTAFPVKVISGDNDSVNKYFKYFE